MEHTPQTIADLDQLKPFNVRTLDHSQPHSDWGGWIGFLKTCEVRRWEYGVVYYGKTNCNYILFPNGTIISNYAFWGDNLMRSIAANGWQPVLSEIVKAREDLTAILNGQIAQPLDPA